MNRFRLILIVMLSMFATSAVHAETLDDKSIRDMYAAQAAVAFDAVKLQTILQERLADDYKLESDSTTIMAGNPPQSGHSITDKAGTISDAYNSRSFMNIQNYKTDVQDIKYVTDQNIANTTVVSSSSGLITVPIEAGQRATVHYDVVNQCQDKLSLIDGMVKYKFSKCDSKISFTR